MSKLKNKIQQALEQSIAQSHTLLTVSSNAVLVGFDVSTRETGVAVVKVLDGELVGLGTAKKVSPTKLAEWEGLGDMKWDSGVLKDRGGYVGTSFMAEEAVRIAREISEGKSVVGVAVEDFMRAFAVGRFRTQGLFALARLNGAVADRSRSLGENSKIVPILTSPNRVRSYFGLNSRSEDAIKARVLETAESLFPGVDWDETMHDRADAALLARYTCAMLWEERLIAAKNSEILHNAIQTSLPQKDSIPQVTAALRSAALIPIQPSLTPSPVPGVGLGVTRAIDPKLSKSFTTNREHLRSLRAISRAIRTASHQRFALPQ